MTRIPIYLSIVMSIGISAVWAQEPAPTWERVNTEDGYEYRRSRVWLNLDGTPLRQHERTMAGTDPYNYTREHTTSPSATAPAACQPIEQFSWWQKMNPFRKRGNVAAFNYYKTVFTPAKWKRKENGDLLDDAGRKMYYTNEWRT